MNTESSKPKFELTNRKRFYRKRWTIPYVQSKYNKLILHNELVDRSYMELIKAVKTLYTHSNTYYYERDTRTDSTLNTTTMHTFITPSLYLELECEYFSLKCRVLYDFKNYNKEQEVRKLLSVYPLSHASIHEPRINGVSKCFKNTLALHGDKHFHYL